MELDRKRATLTLMSKCRPRRPFPALHPVLSQTFSTRCDPCCTVHQAAKVNLHCAAVQRHLMLVLGSNRPVSGCQLPCQRMLWFWRSISPSPAAPAVTCLPPTLTERTSLLWKQNSSRRIRSSTAVRFQWLDGLARPLNSFLVWWVAVQVTQ